MKLILQNHFGNCSDETLIQALLNNHQNTPNLKSDLKTVDFLLLLSKIKTHYIHTFKEWIQFYQDEIKPYPNRNFQEINKKVFLPYYKKTHSLF